MSSNGYAKLLSLNSALRSINDARDDELVITHLENLCKTSDGEERRSINSKNAAELIAFGLLKNRFPTLQRIKETTKCTTDFSIYNDVNIEVYCPQTVPSDDAAIAEQFAKQKGLVKMAISKPLIGSKVTSAYYPTNVLVDRVLNKKRDGKQFVSGKTNILWLDLMNGFEVKSHTTRPMMSYSKGDITFWGCFGIWHSFYGNSECKFPSDRSCLQFQTTSNSYMQSKEGIFRENLSLSAALIFTIDGIILFENPWSESRISTETLNEFISLYMFRPEFSFFNSPFEFSLKNTIDDIITRINWLQDRIKQDVG